MPSNAKNVTFSTFEVNVYKILGNFPEENHDGIIWCMPKKIVQSQSSKKRWATCDAELTLLQIRSLIKMRYQSPKHRQFCTFFSPPLETFFATSCNQRKIYMFLQSKCCQLKNIFMIWKCHKLQGEKSILSLLKGDSLHSGNEFFG